MVFPISSENIILDTCFLSEFFVLCHAASHEVYSHPVPYKAAGGIGQSILLEDMPSLPEHLSQRKVRREGVGGEKWAYTC